MQHLKNLQTSVIIIGAGFSGISAAKTLSDAGITNLTILEASNRIGGRICKTNFGGTNVELGANWVEGVNGEQTNPIWEMAEKLGLTNFYSDYSKLSSNTYKQTGGLYDKTKVEKAINLSDNVHEEGQKLSKSLPPSGREDINLLTMQRLQKHVPSKPLDMVVDYYSYDYEFAEPPRVTSLQNTNPLRTFADFGEDVHFVADQRGYESLVYNVASKFLSHADADESGTSGLILDPRLHLKKVVRSIEQSDDEVVVKTEDGSAYKADFVMVSVSLGVLQTGLIKFEPDLPHPKILALYSFDMAVYTKIFLKFPSKFWLDGEGTEFFLYASEKRGYYPIWQQLDKEYPDANILMVTVTDEESRRIEQQDDSVTKDEAMQVLRNMFGNDIPEPTNILVPRWWSDRFFRGCFSNWPVGVNRYEFDVMKAPFKRVHFTGEHTSEHYNGYVHGAYLAGIDSANLLLKCINNRSFEFKIKPKDA